MSSVLLVLTHLSGYEPKPDHVLLTDKFLDGVRHYVDAWPGPVQVIMTPGGHETGNLDDIVVPRKELPFTVEVIDYAAPLLRERLAGAGVVMGVPEPTLVDIPRYCRRLGIPYVLNLEYSLRTRLQIAKAECTDSVALAKRAAWEVLDEARTVWQVLHASELQCNGVPTFRSYGRWNSNALLFFDSRITSDMVSTPTALAAKASALQINKPLQLAFSGRLNRMKGAHFLIPVARALKERQVEFHFSILGDGDYRTSLESEIAAAGLAHCVTLGGVLDFKNEWIKFMTHDVDLFVCCHPQGDPACTYIETLACGVPIVGFANDALAGLLDFASGAGWTVPIGVVDALANKLQELSRRRDLISAGSLAAREFAIKNTFEASFNARMEHLIRLLDTAQAAV